MIKVTLNNKDLATILHDFFSLNASGGENGFVFALPTSNLELNHAELNLKTAFSYKGARGTLVCAMKNDAASIELDLK